MRGMPLLVIAGLIVTTPASALTLALPSTADTFVNSAVPDNNDGASPSLYTGENGQHGLMRTLLRFDIPSAWQGRVTVTQVALTLVTRGTATGDAMPPTPATESLQAISVGWIEGTGFGDSSMANTVGQTCGTAGATWSQPNCAGGTPWMGGSVSATVSGTAEVPMTVESPVTWDSASAGNAGMVADVQSWIDAPASNQGWRLASSTEGTAGHAQRFYSREVVGKGPTLSVTIACAPGLSEADDGCISRPDAGASDATGPAPTGSGGCSCSTGAAEAGRPSVAVALALAGASALVRRRRVNGA